MSDTPDTPPLDPVAVAESDAGTALADVLGGSKVAENLSSIGSLATNPLVLLLVIGGGAVAAVALLRALNPPGGGTGSLRERVVTLGKRAVLL